jgi:hypothetical protein
MPRPPQSILRCNRHCGTTAHLKTSRVAGHPACQTIILLFLLGAAKSTNNDFALQRSAGSATDSASLKLFSSGGKDQTRLTNLEKSDLPGREERFYGHS